MNTAKIPARPEHLDLIKDARWGPQVTAALILADELRRCTVHLTQAGKDLCQSLDAINHTLRQGRPPL